MNTLLYSNRVNIPYSVASNQNPRPVGYNGMMVLYYKPPVRVPIEPTQPPIEEPKGMKWGEPVWFLLHTLSYKVKDDIFPQFKDELFRIIYAICTNLPCPTCSEHAKTYLDGINMKTIDTKEKLKIMLFTFHNEVNKKKGYPFFSYEDCELKYSRAITKNIVENFMPHFSDRNRSLKLMASDFQKSFIVKMLKEWFQKNVGAFDA